MITVDFIGFKYPCILLICLSNRCKRMMYSQYIIYCHWTHRYPLCLLVIIVFVFNLFYLLVPGIWHTDADGEKEIHHKSWGIHLRHPQLIPGHCLHLLFLSPVVWNSWTAVNVLSNWSSINFFLCLSDLSDHVLPAWYWSSVQCVVFKHTSAFTMCHAFVM